MAETIERWVCRKSGKSQKRKTKRERPQSGKVDGAISGKTWRRRSGGNTDEMKLPILVFSILVHSKTFGREIIGREERSWCNDGKTVSQWVGRRGEGLQRKLQVSLPVSTNQILHSDNRPKHFMSMHKCTGR